LSHHHRRDALAFVLGPLLPTTLKLRVGKRRRLGDRHGMRPRRQCSDGMEGIVEQPD